ncbi:MAG TPA: paraquat-inducible protein A [Polyangia bacterium]
MRARINWKGASLLGGLVALVAIDVWCAVEVHQRSQERARIEQLYSDVNGIENGMLSVDVWMAHLRRMVAHQIDHFSLTGEQRQDVRIELQKMMEAMLTDVDRMRPETVKGKIAKAAVGMLALHREVPRLADSVLDEAGKPETRHRLKKLVMEKLDEYAAETRDTPGDRVHLGPVYARFGVDNRSDFNRVATARAAALQRSVRDFSFMLVASLLLVLASWALVHRAPALRRVQRPVFVVSVVVGLVVLLASLSSPMIEIDARIRQVDFVLVGEHLRFDNQVLFYQSKSIFEVVRVLFATHQADSMLVGALILAFSILLPITKLVSTELVLLGGPRLERNRWLQILAFKTGKWSMADVLVVAIFMAYVGFKAILDSQLKDLNVSTPSLTSIATNRTSLQPAFMVFVAFVLFSLILAEILRRVRARDAQT